MHFPAKGKPKKADTMDIQRVGFAAEAISRWVGEQTEIQVNQLHHYLIYDDNANPVVALSRFAC